MKVRLNLATAPLENNRRFILGAGLVSTAAVLALVVLSVHVYRGWRADRELSAETLRLQAEIRDLQDQRGKFEEFFRASKTRELMDRAAFLNSLIEQRSFPWTKIFMDLERELPAGVRVVSISPRMQEGRVEVKLVVGATTDEGKLKFLKALENSREFSRIQVLTETRPARQGEADQVLLELAAWYATM